MRQFWLAKKENKRVALKPFVRESRTGVSPVIEFEIVGQNNDFPRDFDPAKGTVSRAVATCLVCGSMVDANTTRKLFQEGKAGQRMVAVALHHPKRRGKTYRIATEKDLEVFYEAEKYLEEKRAKLMEEWGIDPVPDEKIPLMSGVFNVPIYGMHKWGDLFNSRQKLALITFAEKVREIYQLMVGQSSRLTKPIKDFTISRRHLPHWQSPNAVYFITTRCIEGKALTQDQRDVVIEVIRYLDKRKYILYTAVVMPDHFHLIIQPIEKVGQSSRLTAGAYYSLSEIMHSIKSFTSHKIGRSIVSIDKQIWQHENFDRVIRDENELFEKMNYILNNPVKRGLVDAPDKYKWLYYGSAGRSTVSVDNDEETSGDACPTSPTIYYDEEYAKVVVSYLALGFNRLTTRNSNICVWHYGSEQTEKVFGLQALPMKWSYPESNPFTAGNVTGFLGNVDSILSVLENICKTPDSLSATVIQASATSLPYKDNFFDAVFTDPPYYNNVPYSYFPDFFYVWLKRTIGDLYPELFSTPLTPKSKEIVAYTQNRTWEEAKAFFEENLKKSFQEIYRVLKPNGITTIVYTHKSTSDWETLINSLLDSGLVITASWPIHTEMKDTAVQRRLFE